MTKLRLGALFRAGLRGLSKYTGMLFAVFVVQSLVALACMLAMALVLAQQFSHLPMFDDAVDGDLVSMIWCVRYAPSTFLAIAGIATAALLLWQLVSWFLFGGIVGVFAQLPEGRGATARCFGASGTSTYLTYARLALCSLPGYMLVLLALEIGLGHVADRIEYALTVSQLLGPFALAVLPAALLGHFFWTVADYARIEISLRQESHAPGVIATYLRTVVWVARRPMALVHAGLGWLLVFLVTLAYAYLAHGHAMYGTDGAIMLFFLRQGVALSRIAIRVGVIAGQVELGRTRPLPPRRVETDVKT